MRAQIVFGSGVNRQGEPVLNAYAKAMAVLRAASEKFGGATLYTHNGGWVDNGNYVTEQGFTLQIDTPVADPGIQEFAAEVRDVFEQSCVVLTVWETHAPQFV